ncbi:MAG: glycosyltransferase [Bryobacteraceae bacterium]|nr:glycosyltransferase [Bryobacteraceae bacterium]
MATRDRGRFIPQALGCFAAQTYPFRELIVVDDGEVSVKGLCEGVAGVRYLRLDRRTPTGRKLNLGFECARGSILQKLDDDDYYGPGFLATAAGRMETSRWRRAIAAWDCFLIHLAGSAELRFSGHGWLAGGTLCFRREVWESGPFRAVARDEDAMFLEDHPGRRLRVADAPEQYVLVRHGRNTWNRFRTGADVDRFLRGLSVYPKTLEEVAGPEAAGFYSGLSGVATGRRRASRRCRSARQG